MIIFTPKTASFRSIKITTITNHMPFGGWAKAIANFNPWNIIVYTHARQCVQGSVS